jgi:hypothetical protein
MAKNKTKEHSRADFPRAMFTRTSDDTADKIETLAKQHRVTVAGYLRWLLDDAAAGKYRPSHLAAE